MDVGRENLCPSCQALDLDVLLKNIDDDQPAIPKLMHALTLFCPLCELFSSTIVEKERPKITAVALERRNYLRPPRKDEIYTQYSGQKATLFIYAVDDTTGEVSQSSSGFVSYSKVPDKPLLVDLGKVNYAPLRYWCNNIKLLQDYVMDDLQQLKGPPDEHNVMPSRVIDCHSRSLVPVQGPCDYFTLSYVWGPAAAQESLAGDSLPIRLPTTVEDAMAVVRELGYRYLWVDRYCLDQSNRSDFEAQLNQMADIYRHGFACIVAAAGEDADYGLPGVSTRVRSKQPSVTLGEYTLWSRTPRQDLVVAESKWATRAWTYQEGVFASNWIAFTDEQVYFRRANRGMDNQRRWWKDSCETCPYGSGFAGDMITGLGIMWDSVYMNEGFIHSQLSEYTTRSMTYQSDAVNAMLGIFKRCGKGPYPLSHYFGIPVLGPLVSHRLSNARDPSRSWTLTEALLVSMCWRCKKPGSRRIEFPSWSWAGWHTAYKKPSVTLCNLGLSDDSDISFALHIRMDGVLTDWEAMCRARDWDAYVDFDRLPQELYLSAPTVPLVCCLDPRDKDPSWVSPDTHSHAASLKPLGFCAIFSEEHCEVLIEVNLADDQVASQVSLGKGTAIPLKAILVRQQSEGKGDGHLAAVRCSALIVRKDEAGFTRVGSFELRADNYLVRWKTDVTHHAVEKTSAWIGSDSTEFAKCPECWKRALRTAVTGAKEEMVKLL